jgi:signal transduction histidine kinase
VGVADRPFHGELDFYLLDKSRSQETPGLGLAVAIAKHLVLLHGGTIAAKNRDARGAQFEVRVTAG